MFNRFGKIQRTDERLKDYMPKNLYERKIKRLKVLMEDLKKLNLASTDEMDEVDEVITSCSVQCRQRVPISINGVDV